MHKKLSFLILIIILAGSFILRSSGINYGLPLHLHPDEWSQIEPALKMFNWDLNPHVFYYPSFLVYFLFIIFKILNALIPAFFKITASKSVFYLTGRFVSAVFGTLNVLVIYFIGKKLFDRRVALASAFFFSIFSSHIISSHYAIVDIPLTLFICATIYFCIAIIEEDSLKYFILAGIMGGLSSSTKYTALLLIVVIYGSFLVVQYSRLQKIQYDLKKEKTGFYLILTLGIFFLGVSLFLASSQAFYIFGKVFSYKDRIEKGDLGYYFIEKVRFAFCGVGIIFLLLSFLVRYFTPFKKLIYITYLNKKIIYSALIFVIIFFIISPYILFDFTSFFRDFKFALKVTALGFYENKLWVSENFPPSFISYLRMLTGGGGLIFFIFFILGAIVSLNRKNFIPVSWIVIYFLMVSNWKVSMGRFVLPVLPFAAIYCAAFIFFSADKLSLIIRRNKTGGWIVSERLGEIFALLIIITCSIVPFRNSIAAVKPFHEGSTLVEGFRWIENNIREKSKIVLMGDAPDLTLSDRDYLIFKHFKQKFLEEDMGSDYLKKNAVDYLVTGVYKYNEKEVTLKLRPENYSKLIKEIRPDKSLKGPIIKIYEFKKKE
ncbi:MAG: hypothetical protein A3H37_12140 [Candidatus Schekmanbacteria bacterium RIFCSPLOWO2_02_FULL_38_14]|nr:MAG: hypothetical protein A3H37_12140 [Candidatus Schekmanbacteria bacterium RIFCSPLOWO2_02_FULL_38_14]